MSQLQRQTQSLRSNGLIQDPIERGLPSILFVAKDASRIDLETIYEGARNSLSILSQYDERFGIYTATLFHVSSMTFNRELKTVEENVSLDKRLSDFLSLLGPYFGMKLAHRIVEYLIWRYRIHEFNVDDIVRCVLPFYDDAIFSTVMSVVHVQGTPWNFLSDSVSLSKERKMSIIAKNMLASKYICDSICRIVFDAAVVHISTTHLAKQQEKIILFWISIMRLGFSNRTPSDAVIRGCLSFISKCLPISLLKSASLEVLNIISSSTSFDTLVSEAIISEICHAVSDDNDIVALTKFCQSQGIMQLQTSIMLRFIHSGEAIRQLLLGNVDLMKLYVTGVARLLFEDKQDENTPNIINQLAQFEGAEIHAWIVDSMSPHLSNGFVDAAVGEIVRRHLSARLITNLERETDIDNIMKSIDDLSRVEVDAELFKCFTRSKEVSNKILSSPKLMSWITESSTFCDMSSDDFLQSIVSSSDISSCLNIFGTCMADNLTLDTTLLLLCKLSELPSTVNLSSALQGMWSKNKYKIIVLSLLQHSTQAIEEISDQMLIDVVEYCGNDIEGIAARFASMYVKGVFLAAVLGFVERLYSENKNESLGQFYKCLKLRGVNLVKFQNEILIDVADRLLISEEAVGTCFSRICMWTKSLIESVDVKHMEVDDLISCQLVALIYVVRQVWSNDMVDVHLCNLLNEAHVKAKKMSKKKKELRIIDEFWGSSKLQVDLSIIVELGVNLRDILSSPHLSSFLTLLLQIVLQQSSAGDNFLQARCVRLCRLATSILRNSNIEIVKTAYCDLICLIESLPIAERDKNCTINDASAELEIVAASLVQYASQSDESASQSVLSVFSSCRQSKEAEGSSLFDILSTKLLFQLQHHKELANQYSNEIISLASQKPKFFNAVVNLISELDVPVVLSLLSGNNLTMILELIRKVKIDLSNNKLRSKYTSRLIKIIQDTDVATESRDVDIALNILVDLCDSSSKQEVSVFVSTALDAIARAGISSGSLDRLLSFCADHHPEVFVKFIRQFVGATHNNHGKVLVCFRNGVLQKDLHLAETLFSLLSHCLDTGIIASFFAVGKSFNEAGLALSCYFLLTKIAWAMLDTTASSSIRNEGNDEHNGDEIDNIVREALSEKRSSQPPANQDITISVELLRFFNSFPVRDQIAGISILIRMAFCIFSEGDSLSLSIQGNHSFYEAKISDLHAEKSHILLLVSFVAQRLAQITVSASDFDMSLVISLCQEVLCLVAILEVSDDNADRDIVECCNFVSNWCMSNMDACTLLTFIEVSTVECKVKNLPSAALRFLHDIVVREENSQLQSMIDFDHDLCLDLLDKLAYIIKMNVGDAGLKYALLSIDKLFMFLDETKQMDSLPSVTRSVLSLASTSFSDNNEETCSTALTTIARIVSVLKTAYFPFLSDTCKLILVILGHGNIRKTKAARLDDDESMSFDPAISMSISSAAYICFGELASNLSQFCHPYIQSMFECAISMHDYSDLAGDIYHCYDSIVSNINPEKILSILSEIVSLSSENSSFSSICRKWFQILDRDFVIFNMSPLSNLCVEMLNSGCKEGYCDAVVEFVLKLNRAELKGIYKRFTDWMRAETISSTSFVRRVRFYDLSATLQTRLETLFIPFVATAWNDVKTQLVQLHESVEESVKSKRKRNDIGHTKYELLESIMQLLKSIFSFDCHAPRFVTNAVCGDEDDIHLIADVLQLSSKLCADEAIYNDFVESCMVPCLSNLNQCFLALSLESSWKRLHHEVCCLSRHSVLRVRIASLRTLSALYNHGDNGYMIMIPEALPYLSECLEDESVEQETRKLIEVMEKVSGEELDEYMK